MKRGWIIAAWCLAGCGALGNLCQQGKRKLEQCGFPVSALDCSGPQRDGLESIGLRIADRGCEATKRELEAREVDPRLCALGHWDCPDALFATDTARAVPKHAIVLVSGIDDAPLFDWNPAIADALTALGAAVFHVTVTPWATTSERAADLRQSIEALPGKGRVNLLCYAVAGLDCRYLVSPNGLLGGDASARSKILKRVASITTIATPHHGTQVAAAASEAIRNGDADDVLRALLGEDTAVAVPADAQILATLGGLTVDALAAFNLRVVDEPTMHYESWAGVSYPFGRVSARAQADADMACRANGAQLFRHADTSDALHEWLLAPSLVSHTSADGAGRTVVSPSDGMIAVESAKWGHFRGCVPADHYDLIGQVGHTTRDPRTGFDAVDFYPYVLSMLAAEGL